MLVQGQYVLNISLLLAQTPERHRQGYEIQSIPIFYFVSDQQEILNWAFFNAKRFFFHFLSFYVRLKRSSTASQVKLTSVSVQREQLAYKQQTSLSSCRSELTFFPSGSCTHACTTTWCMWQTHYKMECGLAAANGKNTRTRPGGDCEGGAGGIEVPWWGRSCADHLGETDERIAATVTTRWRGEDLRRRGICSEVMQGKPRANLRRPGQERAHASTDITMSPFEWMLILCKVHTSLCWKNRDCKWSVLILLEEPIKHAMAPKKKRFQCEPYSSVNAQFWCILLLMSLTKQWNQKPAVE